MNRPDFGWDLPPGCRESDLPGNGPDDALWEQLGIGDVVRFVSTAAFLGRGCDVPIRIAGVQPAEELGDLELVAQVLEAKR